MELIDKCALLKFNEMVNKVTADFDDYNTGEGKRAAEQFFWHTFCDYYLEIVKHRLYNTEQSGKKARLSAQHALYNILLGLLKLFAPIMPHITEEVYQDYYVDKQRENCKSIHISAWPSHDVKIKDTGEAESILEELGELAINIISEVRKHKAANQMSIKAEIGKVLVESPIDLKKIKEPELNGWKADVLNTIQAKELEIRQAKELKVEIE